MLPWSGLLTWKPSLYTLVCRSLCLLYSVKTNMRTWLTTWKTNRTSYKSICVLFPLLQNSKSFLILLSAGNLISKFFSLLNPVKCWLNHLAEVPFNSICDVPPSLCDEAEQTVQLVNPVLQRLGVSCLERLSGPLHSELFPGHFELEKQIGCFNSYLCNLSVDLVIWEILKSITAKLKANFSISQLMNLPAEIKTCGDGAFQHLKVCWVRVFYQKPPQTYLFIQVLRRCVCTSSEFYVFIVYFIAYCAFLLCVLAL